MKIKCILATTSEIKTAALAVFIKGYLIDENTNQADYEIINVNCDKLDLPPQPINGSGPYFCKQRLNFIKNNKNIPYDPNNYYFAIESEIDLMTFVDRCWVMIEHKGILVCQPSFEIKFDPNFAAYFNSQNSGSEKSAPQLIKKDKNIIGYDKTLGELLQHNLPLLKLDPKNWMEKLSSVPRSKQIVNSVIVAFESLNDATETKNQIIKAYKVYKDFPKTGIMFEDVFSILKNPGLSKKLHNIIYEKYRYENIDCVLGLESRGFILGAVLAEKLECAFVPVRKSGKLPGNVVSAEYVKEYGVDKFEVQTDSIEKNSRVLIIDDLIATGGSVAAAIELINKINYEEKLNITIVDCCVLREISELKSKVPKPVQELCSVLLC
jgi:adenine phosphoribosyltransferase